MLLDRLDELPLRRHEIRGNPAGLLARLLAPDRRAEGGTRSGRRGWSSAPARREQAAADEAAPRRPGASSSSPSSTRPTTASSPSAGSLDRGDVFLALDCLLAERPDVRARDRRALRVPDGRRARGGDPGPARAPRRRSPPTTRTMLYALARTTGPSGGREPATSPGSATSIPSGDVRRPRAAASASRQLRLLDAARNERAQAQAVAREVEHLLAGGADPEEICVLVADPARQGGAVAAAMEERGIPFHLSGPAALFQRPEVRDAIAWLRVLADPDDSAGGGAGADPAADRAALRRPGAADDDRPAAQARHGLRLRGGARQPPVPARGAGADPGLPQALQRRLGGDGGAPRRRLRAAADRAGRPAPPAPLRRPAGGRRAAARALAAGRAGDRLGAARAARLDPRLRPPT